MNSKKTPRELPFAICVILAFVVLSGTVAFVYWRDSARPAAATPEYQPDSPAAIQALTPLVIDPSAKPEAAEQQHLGPRALPATVAPSPISPDWRPGEIATDPGPTSTLGATIQWRSPGVGLLRNTGAVPLTGIRIVAGQEHAEWDHKGSLLAQRTGTTNTPAPGVHPDVQPTTVTINPGDAWAFTLPNQSSLQTPDLQVVTDTGESVEVKQSTLGS